MAVGMQTLRACMSNGQQLGGTVDLGPAAHQQIWKDPVLGGFFKQLLTIRYT